MSLPRTTEYYERTISDLRSAIADQDKHNEELRLYNVKLIKQRDDANDNLREQEEINETQAELEKENEQLKAEVESLKSEIEVWKQHFQDGV